LISSDIKLSIILLGSLMLNAELYTQDRFQRNIEIADSDTSKTYNMDEVVVTAHRHQEEKPVGAYKQPEWTLYRRFPSTRVYIQTPPGSAQYEQWIEVRVPRQSSQKTVTRLRQELAFGLDYRLQLDLYLNSEHIRDVANSTFYLQGWSAEIRWAIADWGMIFGNPTIYFEYLFFNQAPDKIEPKLLLGGELGMGWHWGANFIYEREIASLPERDEEFAAVAAVSYTILDQKLSIGTALNFASETERNGSNSETTNSMLIGPSIQFRPVKKASIDIEPLFGITEESKKMRMFIVFSWDL